MCLACGEASLGVSLESCGCRFRRCDALCPWRMPHITFLIGSPTPFPPFFNLASFLPDFKFYIYCWFTIQEILKIKTNL